jgi:outer membrane protein assembly factor BamB
MAGGPPPIARPRRANPSRTTPAGYQEISRTTLLKPTTDPRGRRKLGAVNWSHPAYANRHIYARNDEELIAVSLAADDYGP